jgi:hypothetical protein
LYETVADAMTSGKIYSCRPEDTVDDGEGPGTHVHFHVRVGRTPAAGTHADVPSILVVRGVVQLSAPQQLLWAVLLAALT